LSLQKQIQKVMLLTPVFMYAQVEYHKDLDWQRWNQVAKKRILMKVEELRVDVQQTPQAGYYVRPNLMSGGTKVSSLTARSYATEKSTLPMQSSNQEDRERQNKGGMEPDTNFNNCFEDESLEVNEEDMGNKNHEV
jgi:hypothetical protein